MKLEAKLKEIEEAWIHDDVVNLAKAVRVLSEATKSAQDMAQRMSGHLMKAEYAIEELKRPFEIASPMRDGLMASYIIEFKEALAEAEKILCGEG